MTYQKSVNGDLRRVLMANAPSDVAESSWMTVELCRALACAALTSREMLGGEPATPVEVGSLMKSIAEVVAAGIGKRLEGGDRG